MVPSHTIATCSANGQHQFFFPFFQSTGRERKFYIPIKIRLKKTGKRTLFKATQKDTKSYQIFFIHTHSCSTIATGESTYFSITLNKSSLLFVWNLTSKSCGDRQCSVCYISEMHELAFFRLNSISKCFFAPLRIMYFITHVCGKGFGVMLTHPPRDNIIYAWASLGTLSFLA